MYTRGRKFKAPPQRGLARRRMLGLRNADAGPALYSVLALDFGAAQSSFREFATGFAR
jgi:hypothetical protein